jgi:chemosensory pili system protein ChpA (sensor histidine kinase/response regulator)/putative two-component system response regulator
MGARKILIIEDDRALSKLLSHMLEGQDYDVRTAFDGMEGLRLSGSFEPELILLDVNMPLMDGWQLLQAIKSSPKTGSISVVMCTEHSLMKEVEHALSLGACGYIVKPFTAERVLAKVADVLGPDHAG